MTKSGYANALFYVFCLDTARHFLGEGLDEGHPGRKGDDGEFDLKRDRGGGFRRQLFCLFQSNCNQNLPGEKGRKYSMSHKLKLIGFIPFLAVCFALLPRAQALSPLPDRGYPGVNVAEGTNALFSLTTGTANTAIGVNTLFHNSDGFSNPAVGDAALVGNTHGAYNVGVGVQALYSNTTGQFNVAVGQRALLNLHDATVAGGNVAVGSNALANMTKGDVTIAVGSTAGANVTSAGNDIYIGNPGVAASELDTIRIGETQGATYIAGIANTTLTTNTAPVVVDTTTSQLGHAMATSSQRFKDDIKPMAKASEAILSLKPVTFHYKQEFDPTRSRQFGLVAEEVEKINPDLVTRGHDGKAYGVRYEAVNAMLLNEFLKEHQTVQELKSVAAKQEVTIAQQQKQIEVLTNDLQNRNDELEVSNPAPQTVSNQ